MIDTRPFLTLTVLDKAGKSVASLKCKKPRLNPLVNGIGGPSSGTAKDSATHTVDVHLFQDPPADLRDNAKVTVDVEKGKPPTAFTVLRNGIQKGRSTWTLYLRVVTPEVLA